MIEKRQTSLFPGICHEIRTKIHKKLAEKSVKYDEKNEKIELQLFNREKKNRRHSFLEFGAKSGKTFIKYSQKNATFNEEIEKQSEI